MTLSRRSLFKYVGAGTAALTSVPVLAQEKSPKNPYLPEVWDENYDVVVVGGGGAGMAAALLASQNGAKPVIIERLPEKPPAAKTTALFALMLRVWPLLFCSLTPITSPDQGCSR